MWPARGVVSVDMVGVRVAGDVAGDEKKVDDGVNG